MPPLLDLRPLSRDADRVQGQIRVQHDYQWKDWVLCGPLKMWPRDDRWDVRCYMLNHTDREHDSAYVLWLELVGVQLSHLHYGRVAITGYLSASDPDSFRVPSPSYNPLKDAVPCESCKGEDAHLVVERFTPALNEDLFIKMAGRKVEIFQTVALPGVQYGI